MMGTRLFCISAALLTITACGGSGGNKDIECGVGTSGALASGASVTVGANGKDLKGAAITATAKTTVPAAEVSIECAADIVPAGYIALGPAVKFGTEGTWSDRPFELTLPYKSARLPKDALPRHVRIVAKREGQEPYFPAVANRVLADDDEFASTATFRAGELTTYQVVASATAGQKVTETFQWRAMV